MLYKYNYNKRYDSSSWPLAMRNVNKTAISKVAKILSTIDFGNNYSWAISNIDIDIIKNLKLTDIKKD